MITNNRYKDTLNTILELTKRDGINSKKLIKQLCEDELNLLDNPKLEYRTVTELANTFGLNRSTVYKIIARYNIPFKMFDNKKHVAYATFVNCLKGYGND